MLKNSVQISTESITEYGDKNGKYTIEAPIVDLGQVEHNAANMFELPEDSEFKWIEKAVKNEFPERIYSESDDDYALEDDIEDDEITDDEDLDYEEIEEELDEEDLDEEDLDDSYCEIFDRPLTILNDLTENWPDEAKNAMIYMLRDENMSYQIAASMTNLGFSQRADIFKDWIKKHLLEELTYNIGSGDEKGFRNDVFDSMDTVIYYLRNEEDYKTAFYFTVTLLYLYRYIFAVVEQEEDSVTNYLAEKIYRLWEIIEIILMHYAEEGDSSLKYAADVLFNYLSIFKKSAGLSIIDLSMYTALLILSNKEDDTIIDDLYAQNCNIVSARYKKAALYFYYKNNYKEIEMVFEATDCDMTDRMLLASYCLKYNKYAEAAEMYENLSRCNNKDLAEDALDELVTVYDFWKKDKKLLQTYYRQLKNGYAYVFSNMYEFIMDSDIENQDDELVKLIESGKKYLDKKRYFDALIECRLFEQALDFIKQEDNEDALLYIGGILAYNIQYHSDDEELYDFIKEGLLELDLNKHAGKITVLRQLLDKYL